MLFSTVPQLWLVLPYVSMVLMELGTGSFTLISAFACFDSLWLRALLWLFLFYSLPHQVVKVKVKVKVTNFWIYSILCLAHINWKVQI